MGGEIQVRNDKANYAYFLLNGNCPRCNGLRKVEPGRRMCAVCAEQVRESNRRRRARWKAEGRCHQCGGELKDDGYVTCENCRGKRGKKKRLDAKARWQARKDAGMCAQCGKRWAEAGKTMCKPCLKALKDRERRNDPDHAKKYARRQARIDAGKCIDCGRKVEPGNKRCNRCREMRRDSEIKYRLKKKLAREKRG